MKNPNISKHFIFLLLIISSVVLPQSAFANYASSCAGCHGQLSTSSKKGASASNIQSAINNNKGNMGVLSSLTPAEVNAIAVELGATPVQVVKPTPAPTPVPVVKPTPTPAPVPAPVVKPTPAPIILQTPPTNGDDDDNEDDHDSNHHGESDKHQKHHSHSGSVGKNKSGAAKTDSYEVTCAKGTKSLAVSVMDLTPPKDPLISIQAFKGKKSSPLSIDKVDGDANYSRSEILSAGAGTYTINVNKGSSKVQGSEAYTAKFSCQNPKGSTASSKLKPVKDQ
jgi:hypothetical protein